MNFSPLLLLSCFLLPGCSHDSEQHEKVNYYQYSNNILLKQTTFDNNKIKTKQYFTNDTVPNGMQIEYFESGLIYCIRWYDTTQSHPFCGVFYDSTGKFDTLKGNPFLDLWYGPDKQICLEVLNPPNITYVIQFTEMVNDKLLVKDQYDPIVRDSIGLVKLKKTIIPEVNHKYLISYCIIDTFRQKILYKFSKELPL